MVIGLKRGGGKMKKVLQSEAFWHYLGIAAFVIAVIFGAPLKEALSADVTIASARHPGLALVATGQKVFKRKCKTCHSLKEGKNKIGPSLYGLFGREAGTAEGYRYSKAMKNSGIVWDDRVLNVFIAKPKLTVPKTKMSFRGIRKEEDRKALIEYLRGATKPKEGE